MNTIQSYFIPTYDKGCIINSFFFINPCNDLFHAKLFIRYKIKYYVYCMSLFYLYVLLTYCIRLFFETFYTDPKTFYISVNILNKYYPSPKRFINTVLKSVLKSLVCGRRGKAVFSVTLPPLYSYLEDQCLRSSSHGFRNKRILYESNFTTEHELKRLAILLFYFLHIVSRSLFIVIGNDGLIKFTRFDGDPSAIYFKYLSTHTTLICIIFLNEYTRDRDIPTTTTITTQYTTFLKRKQIDSSKWRRQLTKTVEYFLAIITDAKNTTETENASGIPKKKISSEHNRDSA